MIEIKASWLSLSSQQIVSVVVVSTFFSVNLSSNPAEVYSFLFCKIVWQERKNGKEAGDDPFKITCMVALCLIKFEEKLCE